MEREKKKRDRERNGRERMRERNGREKMRERERERERERDISRDYFSELEVIHKRKDVGKILNQRQLTMLKFFNKGRLYRRQRRGLI